MAGSLENGVVDATMVVTRNDSKTRVSLRDRLLLSRHVRAGSCTRGSPFYARIYIYTYTPLSSGASSSSVVRSWYATRGARGSDFCVGNGRSNKIRTPDNFRLRVISLTCPVDVGLPPPPPSSFSTSSSSSSSSSASPSPPPHPAHLFAAPLLFFPSHGRTSTDFSFTDAARTFEVAGRSLF